MDDRLRALLDAALAANLEGSAWEMLYDRMIHQGTVCSATYELFPHVVDAMTAPTSSLCIDLGFVASSMESDRSRTIPPELIEASNAAIARALPIVLERFLVLRAETAPTYRGQPTSRANQGSYLALSCLALARHRVGRVMWEFPAEPQPGRALVEQHFCTVQCPACEAELEWMHQDDGIVEYTTRDGDQPPIVPPPIPALLGAPGPWAPIAALLPDDPIARVARAVLAAGVPAETPDAAALCVSAAMIDLYGESDWGRRFSRLASDMRCPECEEISPFVECLTQLRQN
jgi:hypothetical protein